jgi:hypothetical protein
VLLGEDAPLEDVGASNLAFLDSLLTLDTEIYAQASSESAAVTALMDLRRQQHVAIRRTVRSASASSSTRDTRARARP